MESLQLSQVLADLSNLGAAVRPVLPLATFLSHLCLSRLTMSLMLQEPEAAAAIVNANNPVARTDTPYEAPTSSGPRQAERPRPSAIQRAWSSEAGLVDKFGRKIKVASPSPRSNSAANSTPGTPRLGESDVRVIPSSCRRRVSMHAPRHIPR